MQILRQIKARIKRPTHGPLLPLRSQNWAS